MNKFWVIVGEVYKKNVKSGAFLSMVLSPVIIIAVIGIVAFFVNSSSEVPKIAIVSDNQEIVQLLKTDKKSYKVNAKITTTADAEKALKKDDIAGYLVINESKSAITGEFIKTPTSADVDTTLMLQTLTALQTNQIASNLGLSQEEVGSLTQPADIKVKTIKFDGDKQQTNNDTDTMIKVFGAYFVSFVIY
ncbi:MAG: ABC transporter permease, partial [Carnobacterium sp.]